MGPTASGKTNLAVALAEQAPFSIISVDSAMVYRGMDIGTAKPSITLRARIPHRLIDICDPNESYSAERFRQDALAAIESVLSEGKIPLLVGGTMLYFRALQYGLSPLPAADPVIRAQLTQRHQQAGLSYLYQQLKTVDPAAAERIHANDPQRIMRALEVYLKTGQTWSALCATGDKPNLPYRVLSLALAPLDRSLLHKHIALRFQHMLDEGFVEEVCTLQQRGDLSSDTPAMRAVGYRQIWDYLAGHSDYATMVTNGITATRQLAKRQMTWLRALPDTIWFDSGAENLVESTLKQIKISNP
jgi:tRNA dimethylallyltransferase